MLTLPMSPSVSPSSVVCTLTTIIYNQYQMPIVCNLVEYPLDIEDSLLLVKDQSMGNHYFMAIKVCEHISRDEEHCIEKLMGLSDKILCIELDQELESAIEKYYITVMPDLFVRYAGNSNFIKRPSICFINETYRKGYSREIQGIYYHKTVQQYLATLPSAESRGQQLSDYKEEGGGDAGGVTVGQILSLYNNMDLSQRDVAQIKYSMLSYRQSIQASRKKEKAEQYLFRQGLNDFNKSAMREIGKQSLSRKSMSKLEWKYEKLKNFGELLYEEKTNKELARKYKKCSLFELQQECIILQIKQFYRVWIRNTLKQLRSAFNEIANRRDIKAVGEFRQKCQKCVELVNMCILHCQTETKNYSLLLSMQEELQEFIGAHQNIIKDEYLSALNYIAYIFKYKWRNEPKIYHKAGFFLLILLLASMQSNIIIGITLISVGLIYLAINI